MRTWVLYFRPFGRVECGAGILSQIVKHCLKISRKKNSIYFQYLVVIND